MKKTLIVFSLAAAALVLVALASTESVKAAEPAVKPTRPGVIYIADFVMDTSHAEPQRPRLLNRPGMMREDPAAKEAKLIEAMSGSLAADLLGKSLPARRLTPGDQLPHKGWLVSGRFIDASEGNRAVRTMVGFGAGATDMEVEVSVTDLGSGSRAPFAVFGARSKSGRGPGAIVFRNPYVAAAKFVMSKRHPERDVKKTAGQIAKVLSKMVEESSAR